MASIILSAAGSAIGASTGISYASVLGARLGALLGRTVDNNLLASKTKFKTHGPRLADLGVQTSTYGKMIPIVYGISRIGGNIIWSRPIKETVTTSTSSAGAGGKGGGGRVTQATTSYSYSISLAIGICEGAVDSVLRIWADAKQLDLSLYNVRIYNGTETQLPDSLIQSFESANNTPAYRGLAYVVFEDFPLADFGNRIPNFTFEVQKKALYADYNNETLEEMIKGMVLIPGAGEFVYDTQIEYKIPGVQTGAGWVQQGNQEAINMHNPKGVANSLIALDQLEQTCPNVEWVSVVVAWFGDNMNASACIVKPGVEYQAGAITSPDTWQVAGFTRSTARQIMLVSGSPQYGGTPDDNSIIRLLDELNTRGYNIMFYPIIFMDVSGKPWRGDLTGNATDVSTFFTKTNGYNAFITHYASLVASRVDAFVIGSEMKGLTKVTDTPGNYPAVNQLVSLAATVKGIVGSGVKVTYAADWSEYHHTDGGWYNMDPLWASSNIDVIGIDAYFPLTDSSQSIYDIDAVKAGWTSGEGYDWYYSDPARTVQSSLSPAYAWKNIAWFWNNTHTNPNSVTTAWTPQSKKIWFTEYGFPSVDLATNQPNVFYDPNSSSSALPHFSKGRVDFRAQRIGLIATEQNWKNSTIVERLFVWTWDARPYPYWPDLTNIWSDGDVWKTGHWVQGKLGISGLAAIISDLCVRAGLSANDLNVDRLSDQVEGYIINNQQSIRDCIETLQQGYFFDAVESDNILKFIPRGGNSSLTINENELVPQQSADTNELFKITRTQEIELPKRTNIVYLNRLTNYQSATQYSQREVTNSRETTTIDLPIVFSDQIAKTIADSTLFLDWLSRTAYQFSLPTKYVTLEPADIINVVVSGVSHRMRIIATHRQTTGIIKIKAVADDVSVYNFYTVPGSSSEMPTENINIPLTRIEFIDTAAFPVDDTDKGTLRIAGVGLSAGWVGAALYRSDDDGSNYSRLTDISAPAAIGMANSALWAGPTTVFDEANEVTIILVGETELTSVSELAVLNGANAALLGDEIIQFKNATLIEPGKYTLRGLLRGRLGTEWAVGIHSAGDRFILLDGRINRQAMSNSMKGLLRKYKPVTFGNSIANTTAVDFTYTAAALKPYSPVHIAGSRDGSGNLSISWTRRTRLGGNWQDNVDIPLNEILEAYEVDILNGATVVHTISNINTPNASYSAAQQVTDFGSAQSSIAVKVYQISGLIGRGYPGQATI